MLELSFSDTAGGYEVDFLIDGQQLWMGSCGVELDHVLLTPASPGGALGRWALGADGEVQPGSHLGLGLSSALKSSSVHGAARTFTP